MNIILSMILSSVSPNLIESKACTLEYRPVCGEVRECVQDYRIMGLGQSKECKRYKNVIKTFGNRCVLEQEGAKFLHEGVCP